MSSDGVSTHSDDTNLDDVVIPELEEETNPQLNGRNLSWTKLRRVDSLDVESASLGHSAATAMVLFIYSTLHMYPFFKMETLFTLFYFVST